jgi:16S rRNA (guanine966-N2)-methyltransferase
MRIVAGAWRGRTLVAPRGQATRPTADRVRQALFDMLVHAEWGGREAIEGAAVLDVFAGTGALGLEALSRGAATACFIESDAAALKALRENVAACNAEDRAKVIVRDVLGVGIPAPVSWPGLARPSTSLP